MHFTLCLGVPEATLPKNKVESSIRKRDVACFSSLHLEKVLFFSSTRTKDVMLTIIVK